uniref:Uncharacterized protein n=1 Tax=Magnetococcus massalia (strain MO-1) TaxID=451514 RepID=A0A1S7LK05_MAGMO|nr:Protein of unknown function [Candidatus Magnetococcus massalia]
MRHKRCSCLKCQQSLGQNETPYPFLGVAFFFHLGSLEGRGDTDTVVPFARLFHAGVRITAILHEIIGLEGVVTRCGSWDPDSK